MLIPNLSVLLAERRLTLSRVAQDTGLSRTTLTALTGRDARGIQFDTLNRLCQYLKVTPGDLFIYLPFDLALSVEGALGHSRIALDVTGAGGAAERFTLLCDAEPRYAQTDPATLDALRVRLSLPDAPEDAERNRRITALLRSLPGSVLADLERDILARFDENIDPALAPQDYSPSLLWPWEGHM